MPNQSSTLSPNPVKGSYGFRARHWARARERGAKQCACGRQNLSPTEAKRGQCWRCEDAAAEVKQRCKQCKRWVPRSTLSRNLKFCKKCIAVHRAEQSAYVNRPLPVASANPDVDQLASDLADLYDGEPAPAPPTVEVANTSDPYLAELAADFEAARARIAALDAKVGPVTSHLEIVANVAGPDHQHCEGCGELHLWRDMVEAFIKIGCRVLSDPVFVCRPCGAQVSVCVRG